MRDNRARARDSRARARDSRARARDSRARARDSRAKDTARVTVVIEWALACKRRLAPQITQKSLSKKQTHCVKFHCFNLLSQVGKMPDHLPEERQVLVAVPSRWYPSMQLYSTTLLSLVP